MKNVLIGIIALITAFNASAQKLKLISAEYGTKDKKVKVSLDKFPGLENNFYIIKVVGHMGMKDPVVGKVKHLHIKYISDGKPMENAIIERTKTILLPAEVKPTKEDKLIKAWYGSGTKWKDVTGIVAKKLGSDKDFVVNNGTMQGDPCPGKGKMLLCVMSKKGKLVFTCSMEKKKYASLPL